MTRRAWRLRSKDRAVSILDIYRDRERVQGRLEMAMVFPESPQGVRRSAAAV